MNSRRPSLPTRILLWCVIGLLCPACLQVVISACRKVIEQDKKDEALLQAAHDGGAKVQAALEGANVNCREGYGETPLMLAAFYGHTDSVRFLLAHGAQCNLACRRGETALKWAQQNHHWDIARLLKQAGEKQ